MIARCFVDTNVFLYAASKDPADNDKAKLARILLESEDCGISAQVMQEFFAAAVQKKRLGISEAEASRIIESMMAYPVVPITSGLVRQAIEQKSKHHVSYWDAAIIAAAQELGCETIFSEDFNNGQNYGGVVACNPFATQ